MVSPVVFALLVVCAGAWTYEEDWVEDGYQACGGVHQSPININTETVVTAALPAISFSGLVHATNTTSIVNTGHSLQVNLPAGSSITGGSLAGTYNLAQFHFHWGLNNNEGSEHSVNGDFYPLELHAVHFSERFTDVSSAADKAGGLAVVGVFFEIGEANPVLEDLLNFANNIQEAQTRNFSAVYDFSDLLPEGTLNEYWAYDGSLTTPPCYESVEWHVSRRTQTLSQAQLDKFHSLAIHGPHENARPVQSLHYRTVLQTWSDPTPAPTPAPNNNGGSGTVINFNFAGMLSGVAPAPAP